MSMKNPIIEAIDVAQMKTELPVFRVGDTVIVKIEVREGDRKRLQSFEGIVIAKKKGGLDESFIVRKMSGDESVERVFFLHSPLVSSVTVKRHGDVRRAKLYYLRDLQGKSARVKEKIVAKS